MRKLKLTLWLGFFFLLTAGCSRINAHVPVLTSVSASTPFVVSNPAVEPPVPARSTAPIPSPSPAPIQPAETTATAVELPVHIPDPSAYSWIQAASGLHSPTDIQNAHDVSGRLFILEQAGLIRILQNGQLLNTPFLDIRDRVGNMDSEQGLLGLAFHPAFASNGFLFVNYTDQNGNTHISRFTSNSGFAEPQSEKQLLFVQQPFPNHNGGALAFDPAGYLLIGLGDGGSAGDPYGNGQSLNTFLGKILRIDVDHGDPYGIPTDNPFVKSRVNKPEIWTYGLRNPWRFSFDQKTGDFWVGDVGQNLWEEVDYIPAGSPAGLNLGWNDMEGVHPYNGSNSPALYPPAAEYPHGAECSITGGYVYRGANLPEWQGVYFYGDYCSGKIWGLPSPPINSTPTLLFQTGFKISTFGLDESGELYLADYNGNIYRLEKIQ